MASVLLAMIILPLQVTSAAELRALLSSFRHRLTEPNWRAKALLCALLSSFLAWNVVQVTTRQQYDYPFQKEHYPFTRFAMFTSPYSGDAVTFARFIGYDRSGKRYEINPDKLFPALSHTGLYSRTNRLAFLLQSSAKESRFASDELRLWAASFKRVFQVRDGVELTKIDFARVRHSSRIGERAKMIEESVLWSSAEEAP